MALRSGWRDVHLLFPLDAKCDVIKRKGTACQEGSPWLYFKPVAKNITGVTGLTNTDSEDGSSPDSINIEEASEVWQGETSHQRSIIIIIYHG